MQTVSGISLYKHACFSSYNIMALGMCCQLGGLAHGLLLCCSRYAGISLLLPLDAGLPHLTVCEL
jgi:hypothetical protein